MFRKGLFVDRDREVRYFRDALGAAEMAQAMCIWGLPGVGKSALLRILEDIAREQRCSAHLVSMKGETFVSMFTLTFDFTVMLTPGISPERLVIQKFLNCITGRAVLIIDDYPEDAEGVDSTTSLLVEEAQRRRKMIFLITSSRSLPYIKGATTFRLDGLLSHEVEEFIKIGITSVPGWIRETAKYTDQICTRTAGNPQLIRLLCTNQQAWESFKESDGSPLNSLYSRLMFREIWMSLNEALHEALYALTAMSVVLPTISSEVCTELIHNWAVVASRLERRCLIERLSPRQYKLHDLIRNFIKLEHPIKVARAHDRIGDYYVSRIAK